MIRITPPTTPIATIVEAKAQARVDGDDEDALIQTYLDAATSWVDGFDGVLGRCVMSQTWQASADEVACGPVPLDVLTQVDNEDGSVDYTCALPSEKVASVKASVLLLVAYWYDQRSAATAGKFEDAPLAVRALLAPLRVWI